MSKSMFYNYKTKKILAMPKEILLNGFFLVSLITAYYMIYLMLYIES